MEKNVKNTIEKLEDASLEKVSGGGNNWATIAIGAGAVASVLSMVSGIGCGIANTVCQHKAKSKRDQGDIRSAEKFEKAARVLGPVSLGVGVGGTSVGGVVALCGAAHFS